MPKYIPQPKVNGLPGNPYNDHLWITGEPEIGEGTWIGPFTLLDGVGGLTIGKGCDIGVCVNIISHSTTKRCLTERKYSQIEKCPTVIEDYCFVAMGATILMGCRIGHHSIVAAGSVVLEHTVIPPYSLVAGVPARVVRSLEQEVEKWKQEAESLSR
jgi:acetyltransferase-like isoleucine patch superfamily enzyme